MFNPELGGEMLNLQAATAQQEILDYEESYIIGIEIEKRKASYLGKLCLEKVREKRRVIYESTFIGDKNG